MHIAKRAILMAAGYGSRMSPITINTPKPLVRVKGKRIIDGIIDACLEAGIDEIYIVRGYLAEQFDQLLYKYPMVRFIDNPYYQNANNISSIFAVKDLLSDAYVIEADLYIKNADIMKGSHDGSDFLAIKKDHTDDWCFRVDEGIITEENIGGDDCYQMIGISYWSQEDGKKLRDHISLAYELPNGKELYWEQVPLVIYKDSYRVKIRECQDDDVVEIDTYAELKAIDPAYAMAKTEGE